MVDTPTADSPAEPDITHINPAGQKTWFGHPRQLARLFTTEMWERFGYYGMRALLTLYLTKHFLFGDHQATGLYGGYTALVYLTPLIGGLLADQYLGSKRSVKFGAIVMALGYFTLAFGGSPAKPYAVIDGQRYEVQVDNFKDRPTSAKNEARFLIDHGQKLQIKGNDDGTVALLAADGHVARTIPKGKMESKSDQDPLMVMVLLIALSMISVGNGFFKPNISTMVGSLYEQGDRRRDTGFTIFYMGINMGSILGQLFCPILADMFGWWAGLGLAGVGMLFSWTLIQFDGGRLDGYGEPPARAGPDRAMLIYILAIVAVPALYWLFLNVLATPEAAKGTGFIGNLMALPLLGKMLLRHLHPFGAWHPDLVVVRGQPQGIPDDGGGDGARHLQRRLLDAVRAGGLVADAVRRPQHQSERVRAVQHLGAADAELQPALDRHPRALDEHLLGLAGQARPRAVDPGQVRAGADRRRRGLPVPRLGIDLRRAGLQGRLVVARGALCDPLGRRAVHLAGRPLDDHQAVAGARRRADDGGVVPVDLGRPVRSPGCSPRKRASIRSAGK